MNREILKRQCEVIIREGLDAMDKVDRALDIIRQMELYDHSCQSFETYCQKRWNIDEKYHHLRFKSTGYKATLPQSQNNIIRRKKNESRK